MLGLTVVVVAVLVYLLFSSCTFNNHSYEVVEFDHEYDCHKLKCTRCGHERTNDPYSGLGG